MRILLIRRLIARQHTPTHRDYEGKYSKDVPSSSANILDCISCVLLLHRNASRILCHILYCSSGALAMAHSQHSSSRDGFHSWIKVCSCSCSSLVMTGIYILILYIRGNYFTYWFTYNNANMYLKWHFLHLFLLRQWVVAQFPQTITYHKRKLHFNLPHSM